MAKFINRKAEAEILSLLGRYPAVAIIGPRQVGKTTLAKLLGEKIARQTRYLDLEYPADFASLQEPVVFLERLAGQTVILDEVQRMVGLFPVLRALIDRKREPGRFILLGSATPELIQRSSESLAGRIAYVELSPFAFSELPGEIAMEDHWLRGGFPDSLLAANDEDSMDWRKNFVKTYLERDLPMLGLQADPILLNRLWTMLAHLNSGLLNKEALSKSLSLNNATVGRYFQFFESAFLVRTLQPYAANLSKRLIKTPKVYLRDTGILHYLANIRSFEGLMGSPMLGASWEAYVVNQVAFHLPQGWEMFFYRTHDGTEADLVLANGGVPEALVEIKFSTNPNVSKGFHIASTDLKTNRHFVICPIQSGFPLKHGIEAIGIAQIPQMFEPGRWQP